MSILDSLRPAPHLRVLVTAGGAGIGAAVARAFQQAGARVHVCDVDRAALDRLARDAPGLSSSMADASVPANVDGVFRDVQAHLGGLDVLISNAAIAGPAGRIEDLDGGGWERTIAVNLHGQFYFARRAVPLLKRSARPSLVAIGPAAGRAGAAAHVPHAASRWAVVGLVKSLAGELVPQGVRVNAILPPPAAEGARSVDAVAALALFLCSPGAGRINGQAVSLEGDADAF
jgi:NAD(P)-dependent dehydrogenase (short-subunit alcohol dehydrogenase family)